MFTTNDIVMFLFAICGVCSGFILLLYFLTSRSKYHYQRRALKQYELVLNLIRTIQRHRGLSQGVISGESALQEKLFDVQREISYLIESLNLVLSGKVAERWESFFDHWQRLRGNSVNVEAEDSFQQHNHMINNLLYLAENICNNSDLGHSVDHAKDQTLWRQLLVLSECIGQSRALGASALARGQASYLELIRFQLLRDNINDRLYSLDDALSQEKVRDLEEAVHPVKEALKLFVADVAAYPYSSQEYFAIATLSLEHVTQVLDEELAIMKQKLNMFTQKSMGGALRKRPAVS